MKRFLLALFCLIPLFGEEPISVLVTLSPYQFVVEEIGGPLVSVTSLVPPAASGHTYEPSAKEMVKVSQARVWFRMGEPFEDKILPVLKAHNPSLLVVDLRDGIPLIFDEHSCPHCRGSGSEDLHFWLSPHIVKIQAEKIAAKLKAMAPEKTFNLDPFLQKLAETDSQIVALTKDKPVNVVLVAHPAYAYFCRDYGFRQLSIEIDGKDPKPKQLIQIVSEAKKLGIRKVFTQPQYSTKGAELIAGDLGAKVIMLDPYGKNLFQSLLQIAKEFGS